MPTAAQKQRMLDSLWAAWQLAVDRLNEFDARVVSEGIATTFVVNGQSYELNGYRASLEAAAAQRHKEWLAARKELADATGADAEIFTFNQWLR